MATVPFKFEGDAASVVAAYQAIQEQIKRTRSARRDAGQEGDRLVERSLQGLQGTVASWFSVGAAIGAATSALRQYNQALDESAQKRQASFGAEARLAQVVETPAEMGRALRETAAAYGAGGFASRGDAANLIFELQSAGALGERPFFARLQGVEDSATMARAAATLRNAMGAAETGNLQAIVSKAFAGAAPAPGVSAAGVAGAAAGEAVSARMLGLSDEELIAAVSILSEKTGSAGAAGTQVGALFKGLTMQGVESGGRGLAGYLAAVKAKGLSGQALIKFFGREEGMKAFGQLADADLAGRIAEVRAAEAGDLAGQKIALAEGVPELAAARAAMAGTAGFETSMDPYAIFRNRADAIVQRRKARLAESGHPVLATLAGMEAGVRRTFADDRGTMLWEGTQEDIELLKELNNNLRANTAATRANTEAARGDRGVPVPPTGE